MEQSNHSEHQPDGMGHAMHERHHETGPKDGDHAGHLAHMAADFRKRFWVSLVITLPILVLSPMLQEQVGLRGAIRFPNEESLLQYAIRFQKKFPVDDFKGIAGKGAEGRVDGKEVKVVSPDFLREQNIAMTDKRVEELQVQGKTVVFVLIDGELKWRLPG